MLGLWLWALGTAIGAPPIAFTGYRSVDPDQVSFVLLEPAVAGDVITFTDIGWDASGGFPSAEGVGTWTASAAHPAGTQVSLTFASGGSATVGTWAPVSRTVSLALAGDQILAYTGAAASPTFVAGLQMNGPWDPDAVDTNTSALPPGGGAFLAIDPERDNAVYDCSVSTGTAADLRTALLTPSRWRSDDAVASITIPPACTFVVRGPQIDTFDAGLAGWTYGQPTEAGLSRVAAGGPQGATDAYLRRVSTGGSGANSKLVLYNSAQWAGSWTGRRSVYAYARASAPLVLRLSVEGSGGVEAASTVGRSVPADGRWHLLRFDVDADDFTPNAASILPGVTRLRIQHQPELAGSAPPFAGELHLDHLSDVAPASSICGDDLRTGAEVCDTLDVAGVDCASQGYSNPDGAVCALDCGSVSYDACEADCGDSNVEPGEACDVGGFGPACDDDCTAVTCGDGLCNPLAEDAAGCPADCPASCGDGEITHAEVCDGPDTGDVDCTDLGFTDPVGVVCDGCDDLDTSGCAPTCGDGDTEPGEACDSFGIATPLCDADCTPIQCGDGLCNVPSGENANTCGLDCATTCGDGVITSPEVCDGTNLGGNDCTDGGYVGAAGARCADGCRALDLSSCTAACRNGVREPGEACDPGSTATATCDTDCTAPTCGDGLCNAAAGERASTCPGDCPASCGDNAATHSEVCDGTDLDGADCRNLGYSTAAGMTCESGCGALDPSGCAPDCGDGRREPGEDCDDHNEVPGDGCDSDCLVEPGWSCGTTCSAQCGDGRIVGLEQCDDGDDRDDDGCHSDCTVEDGWVCDEAAPSFCQTDGDGDEIADADDNCPDDPNHDQFDEDDDDIGDICDPVLNDSDSEDTETDDSDTGPGARRCGCAGDGGAALLLLVPFGAGRRRRRPNPHP
jgi:cysteine-rich repeat protein